MSTFNEADHPRTGDGKFTDKPLTAPEVSLNPNAIVERTVRAEGDRAFTYQKYADGREVYFVESLAFGTSEYHRDPAEGPAKIDADGTKHYMVWGRYHRDGGLPAVEGPQRQEWWVNGLEHRDGGLPSAVYTTEEGLRVERYSVEGKRHREDGPAEVAVDADGNTVREYWFRNDVWHREGNLPACRELDADGNTVLEYWFRNDAWHREGNLPAYRVLDEETGEMCEEYYLDGEHHRTDGPAYMGVDPETNRFSVPHFFAHGQKYESLEALQAAIS